MFMKPFTNGAVCLAFCASLTVISASSTVATGSSAARHSCSSAEKALLIALGLDEEVNDSEIIRLLYIPVKRIYASGLIRYRKISSATPELVQIVNDDGATLFAKLAAAEALCDFGNKEWIKVLKPLVADPNSRVHISSKIQLGGLLARAGDYSQLEFLASHVAHPKRFVRSGVVQALGNFRGKGRTEVSAAAQLVARVATSDPSPW
ncbi:MAG: HEAT repeat domain-containing protein, partial [Phycisphaerales bacterium]